MFSASIKGRRQVAVIKVLWKLKSAVIPTAKEQESRIMSDIVFILCTVVFFAVSIAYVYGCERLK